jgi:hypothetical protein
MFCRACCSGIGMTNDVTREEMTSIIGQSGVRGKMNRPALYEGRATILVNLLSVIHLLAVNENARRREQSRRDQWRRRRLVGRFESTANGPSNHLLSGTVPFATGGSLRLHRFADLVVNWQNSREDDDARRDVG